MGPCNISLFYPPCAGNISSFWLPVQWNKPRLYIQCRESSKKVRSHNKLLNYTSYRIAHSTMAKWGLETTFMILAYIPVGEIIEFHLYQDLVPLPLPRATSWDKFNERNKFLLYDGLIINWCKTLLNHIHTGVGRYNYWQDTWGT